MKNHRNTRLIPVTEELESRRLLTSLPAVSFTSETFEFPGGFQQTVLAGEMTDLNRDSTGPIRQNERDYVIIREGNKIEFWLHDEDGEHSRAAQRTLGGRPSLLVPGDLNSDGYDDFVVGTDKGVEVFLNLGADVGDNRAWRGIDKVATFNTVATSIALDRIDGDGFLDLVITSGENLEVHPGLGDGSFGPSISYPIGPGFHQVVVGDLNGDSQRDVVVGSQTERSFEGKAVVFLNDDGILESGQTLQDTGPVRTMTLADLNSDGLSELIVGTWESRHLNDPGGENIHVWSGKGDGTFASDRRDYETAGSPLDFAVGDVNVDGIVDLVVGYDSTFHHPITNNGPGAVSVLLGAGEGALLSPVRISSPGGLGVSVVDSQISSFQQFGNSVAHFEWNHELRGSGEDFMEPVSNLFTRRTTVMGDFNGNGILDAAVGESFQPGGGIRIHLDRAEGVETVFEINLPEGFTPNVFDTGDLNGDGLDDLAITGRADFNIQTIGLLSQGDGTFSAAIVMPPGDFSPLDVFDVNGDGRDDWIGARPSGLVYLKSDADGTRSAEPLARSASDDFRAVAVSSRNEDGSANLIAISGKAVHSLTVDDEGGYAHTSVAADHHFWTFGDFNGDQNMDVAFGKFSNPGIRVIFGSEGGALSEPVIVAETEQTDGLATFSSDGGDAIMLLNQSAVELVSIAPDSNPAEPEFESTSITTGILVSSAYAHDLLGDSTPDLVMLQGRGFISSSTSTQILVSEALPDGSYAQPRHVAVPLVEGQVLATDSAEGQLAFTIAHRWGFANVQLGPGLEGDFNYNGRIDIPDIDLLCAAHRQQDETALGRFDLDGDSDLDDADIDIWIREIAATRRGDVNLDGKVDFSDFLQLSGNFGQTVGGFLGPGGWEQGDTNCDGEVDFADFLMISQNFGFELG